MSRAFNCAAQGHEVKTISGAAVKDWVKVHLAGQKTDRNDALALAHLFQRYDAQTDPNQDGSRNADAVHLCSAKATC